ncbi:MAG: GTPase Era [Alphaproteobacteria bacterium]
MTKKASPKKAPKKLASKTAGAETRAGFVAILGAPNAGKSTLLNRLIGQKISIVSPKAQTTRMRILGVLTEGDTQIGFIDTPGIFAPKRRLDEAMVHAAWNSLQDADVIVLLVDAGGKVDQKVGDIIEGLYKRKKRVVLALNKIDKIVPQKLLPLTEQLNTSGIIDDTFMISALTGDGIDDLKNHLLKKMPKSPWFYGEDQLSDLPSQLLAAEITREQLFRQLQQELPYAATVAPVSWEMKKDGSAVIHQNIIVARANHKPIVLGAKGSRIKLIGQASRREIEKFLGHKAHLFLDVKIDEKWQDRPEFYQMFGLEFKPN